LLAQPLAHVDEAARRFTELGARSSTLKERVLGPRIPTFVRAAFERFDARDRNGVAGEVESILGVLKGYGLERAIAPETILAFCSEALLRSETEPRPLEDFSADSDGYRSLRATEQRSSLAFVLAQVGLRILPELTQRPSQPDDVISALSTRLAALPEALRKRVVARDLERIERPITLLERFWAALTRDLSKDPAPALERLAQSGFFAITTDEAALSRFALELSLLELLGLGGGPKPLVARIRALEEKSSALVRELTERQAEADWKKLLTPANHA
jgi:hypothetical protein